MSLSLEHSPNTPLDVPRGRISTNHRITSMDFSGSKNALLLSEIDMMHGGHDDNVRSTNVQASFTLFKVFVGSGILALPLTFARVGFGLAIVGMLVSATLAYYCMSLALDVVNDMKNQKNLSLQSLVGRLMGKAGKRSVEVSLIIMQLGVGIAILIFASQFLDYVLCGLDMEQYCGNKVFIGGFVAMVVIPLSFITNMHYFYYPSLLATFFILANVVMQLYYNFDKMSEIDTNILYDRMKEFHIEELPKFFGVATYAYEGIGVLFSVRSSMQTPGSFRNVLRVNMIIITLLYTFFPGTSELAFGEETQEIILFNLPITNKVCLSIMSLYVVAQLFGFPVQLVPVFSIMENTGMRKYLFDEEGKPKNLILRFGLRILLISAMLYIALKTKSLNDFLNLLGSCVFVYLGYLIPIIIYHMHFKGKASKLYTVFNVIAFPVSLVLGGIGVVLSLRTMIES